ncbi:methionine synthase [Halodesulfurarchaeum sp. HSR-GB]|uniref:methionine synthase n=1 Tax=Halodesulfurarchaeum sp. HSR-GB TaxID=3074077 RepID=UPI00285CABD9|nr:methionine synthase [Halodesulfurarchaeum sp. HSR-GB]MDR5656416.1 methionine synthase [Halodesulfurarchaeum sp. HSR-GB]
MTREQFRPPHHDHDHFLLKTVVGSFPQPDWLDYVRSGAGAGDLEPADREEAEDDATRAAILDQQNAGLDAITDGEMRREGMVDYFTNVITGYDAPDGEGDDADWNASMPRVTEEVSTAEPWLVEDFEFADRVATRPVKVTMTGPFTLATFASPEVYDSIEDLALDFADLIAVEVRRLAEAGADWIQLDEPGLGMSPHGELAQECLSRVAAEVPEDVRFGTHVCSGNYANLADEMAEFPVDELDLEFASPDADDPAEVFEGRDFEMDIGFGVIDTQSREAESVAEIEARIEEGLQYLSPEQLTVSPDCGLKPLEREPATTKLEHMVTAAANVEAALDAGDIEAAGTDRSENG